MSNIYQPGVCNIGPAEIRSRRLTGIVGAILTVILFVVFVVAGVPTPWKLFILIPAGLGAAGFLQAGLHFCARFGMAGLFNFGDDTKTHEQVYEQEYRLKDQRKAITILVGSALIAVIVFVITAVA